VLKKLTLLASCCIAMSAHAADNGFYFGAGAEHSKFNVQGSLDSTDSGYKIIAGVRLLDSFGVEANYADHGNAQLASGIACTTLVGTNCPGTSKLEATSLSAFAVGFLDFPLVDLFAKAGFARSKTDLSTPGFPSFGGSDTKTGFAWGAGVQAHFTSLAARAEFEQFKLLGDHKLNVVSVSLLYTLL
jgi:opacity protein-like surface antigen